MKRKWLLKILGLMFFGLQLHGPCSALEIETHKKINEYITTNQINNFSLDSYVMNQLGLKTGVETYLKNGKTSNRIREWVRDGGEYEDGPGGFVPPYLRSFNHFHDPLKPLDSAGFTYPILFPVPFNSALKWAQDQTGSSLIGGDWSWKKARDSFYKSLTGLDQDERDKNLADTFRALGQIMHLVQDVSVPAHVRNDPHVYFDQLPLGIKVGKYHYEAWAKQHPREIQSYLERPAVFDESILSFGSPASASIPIANIFDTYRYKGLDDLSVTTGSNIGLAEYTNANFFSEGTVFRNYPHPNYDDTDYYGIDWKNPEKVQAEDGKTDNKIYIKRKDPLIRPDGKSSELLVSVRVFSLDFIKKGLQLHRYLFDDRIYGEYASNLIPRAVSYSASMLKYFFRGQLHIEVLAPSVDQIHVSDNNGSYFANRDDLGTDIKNVAVLLRNNSKLYDGTPEPVGPGTLTLTIGYTDTSSGSMVYQTAGTVSVTGIIPAVGSDSPPLNILFPLAQAIRAQRAKDLTYYFAFMGKLGQEEGAVIGKVVKAPVLYSVSPDEGTEGTPVTLAGDNLLGASVSFNVDLTKPYSVEVLNSTDMAITAKVPNTAALEKPGYGGLRVKTFTEGGEAIYSNAVSFFPIAEGQVRNVGKFDLTVKIEAIQPILGDNNHNQFPPSISSYPIPAGGSVSIQLTTGFVYRVTGGSTDTTVPISVLTPDAVDFVIDVQ
jgi:hypothetical protein